jgi:hypothetical protein
MDERTRGCDLRRFPLLAVLPAALAVGAASAIAQVPGVVNYQGRVTVNGTNFHGNGLFRFALVDGGSGVTYWSNGTSAVSIPVNRGLYSALLGDTNVADMTESIPASIFVNRTSGCASG